MFARIETMRVELLFSLFIVLWSEPAVSFAKEFNVGGFDPVLDVKVLLDVDTKIDVNERCDFAVTTVFNGLVDADPPFLFKLKPRIFVPTIEMRPDNRNLHGIGLSECFDGVGFFLVLLKNFVVRHNGETSLDTPHCY